MDEVLIVSGWVLGVTALAVFVWALFWDRPRGRRRCRRCWYDMRDAGPAPARCTECGREWKTERSMLRTRRRWRWAFAAVLLAIVGLGVGLTPAYRAGRIMTLLPAWALAEMVPLFPPQRGLPPGPKVHPGSELTLRVAMLIAPPGARFPGGARPLLTNREMAGVIRRMAEGNWWAPAGSKRWVSTSGDWLSGHVHRFRKGGMGALQYPDGTPADEALVEAFALLEDVMPHWSPRTRPAWPAGMPVRVESGFSMPRWVSNKRMPREGATWSVRGTDLKGVEEDFLYSFGMPPAGKVGEEVVVDVTLRLFGSPSAERPEDEPPLRERDFVLRWTVAAEPEDVAELVDRPDIHTAMVAGLAAGLWDFGHPGLDPVWLTEPMDRIGFGVRVEILDGDTEIARTMRCWLVRDGVVTYNRAGPAAFGDGITSMAAYRERIDRAMEAGRLRLRLTASVEEGLGMIDAEKVWSGSVEIDVSTTGEVVLKQDGWMDHGIDGRRENRSGSQREEVPG